MKQLLALVLLSASVSVMAHGYNRHYYHNGWGYHNNWLAPALVGGVIGYELARPPVYTQPVIVNPPVVVQQPMVSQPYVATQPLNCGPWTEIRNLDGSITTQRTCQ